MADRKEFDGVYFTIYLFSLILVIVNIYYFTFPFFLEHGWVTRGLVETLLSLSDVILKTPYLTKITAVLLTFCTFISKSGRATDMKWSNILTVLGSGLLLFLAPVNPELWLLYDVMTMSGYILTTIGISLVGRKTRFTASDPDALDTFDQCRELIRTNLSVNLRTRFHWDGRWHKGWCNVVAANRTTLIIGGPGAGKTFSLIEQFIEQFAKQGVVMACYDFKYPELTNIVYNEANLNARVYKKRIGKVPTFYAINFTDPLHSNRCNPIAPRYIREGVDTAEIASIIWENAGTKSKGSNNEFFGQSAQLYIDLCILFLSKFEHGIYCTFAHLIELLGIDYRKVFAIMEEDPDMSVKVRPFANALKGKAQNQLQGQIASAQIPLNRFASPALYWILSGDDIDLNINDPKNPSIVCIGNDPERKTTYSTALALMMGRLFECCNKDGRIPSTYIIDELPTIKLPNLEYIVNTGRSRGMMPVFSVQDRTQLIRDYTKEDADIILGTAGNIFCGATNFDTAKGISDMIGTEEREDRSQTISDNSESQSMSRKEKQLVKPADIVNLTRGFFAGKIVDDGKTVIDKKLFCGEFVRDVEARKERHSKYKPLPYENREDFDIDTQEKRLAENYDECLIEYIAEQRRKEQIDQMRKEAITTLETVLDDDKTLLYMAKLETEEYDDAKKESLRGAVKDFMIQREVDRVVKKKYDSIKEDILMLSRTKSEGGVCPDDWESRFVENKKDGSGNPGGKNATDGSGKNRKKNNVQEYTGSDAPITPVFTEDEINDTEDAGTRE